MTYKIKTVAVHHVFLDNTNPRHEEIDNEGGLIHRLVAAEGVKNLADDIAKWGLSPLDRMAVIPHPTEKNRYIVAEGNRRLCALKLLADPEKASSEPARKVFRELRARMAARVQDLEVVVFENRADARHWLELRHEGPMAGRGTKPWNASQKVRWNRGGRADNPNALALLLLDYAQSRELVTPEQREELSLTTLTRFLSNPIVRDTLGLASNKSISIRGRQEDFDRAVRRFLADALKPETPVHSRTSKEEREAYAAKLKKEGLAPQPLRPDPVELDPETGSAKGPSAKPGARKSRDNRNPRDRRHVIPSEFVIKIKDPILKRIYDELKNIETDEFAFAASALFRGLIEVTTRRYCTKHALVYNERDLHVTLEKVEQHLQASGVKGHVTKGLRVMAKSNDAGFSPETIGSALHGGTVSNRRYLNDGFDQVATGLRAMLERL